MSLPAQVRWILGWQLGLTLGLAVLAGLADGLHALLSALIGGGIAVLANTAYACLATGSNVKEEAKKVFRAQLFAEMLKFALTAFLFALVFAKYREVWFVPLFVAYASTYAVFWLALLRE